LFGTERFGCCCCCDSTKAEELKGQLGSDHPTSIKPISHGMPPIRQTGMEITFAAGLSYCDWFLVYMKCLFLQTCTLVSLLYSLWMFLLFNLWAKSIEMIQPSPYEIIWFLHEHIWWYNTDWTSKELSEGGKLYKFSKWLIVADDTPPGTMSSRMHW
jgi:hypothetical protein